MRDERWDDFVCQSYNGNFLFTNRFLAYHSECGDDRVSVITNSRGDIVSGLRYSCVGEMAHSHPGSTYGGILHRRGSKALKVWEHTNSLLQHLAGNGFKALRFRPVPVIMRPEINESDLYAIHHLGGRIERREMSIIIPIRSPRPINRNRVRVLREAIQQGARVQRTSDVTLFHRILVENLGRHSAVPLHTSDNLDDLLQRLPEAISLFTASLDGDVIAGAYCFDFGATVHIQYLSQTRKSLKVGAGDLLVHFLLDEAYSDREYLSFGTSTVADPPGFNPGLVQFKESFGGISQSVDTYVVPLVPGKLVS